MCKIWIALIALLFLTGGAMAAISTKDEIVASYQPAPNQVVVEAPPVSTPCITPGSISTARYSYSVMVLDGINQSQIQQALWYIPGFFSYQIIPENTTKYYWDSKGYARPCDDRVVVIFDGKKHGYQKGNATGYYLGKGRATIVYLGQDPYAFSWLIEHECLHEALEGRINEDDFSSYFTRWNAWMGARNIGQFAINGTGSISGGWLRLKQDYLVSAAMG